MLQIKKICKNYITGDLEQIALDNVSLNLRDNEFVAILGPSGSGKTTLLNVIGGLDRYESGDLIINGISTKKYKDRDWDSYRNHTIGFVFQNYNLIPHQTILSNVELALTISGISKKERRKKAMQALDQVGLGSQRHKKPNQMSGGQMQRVAIARALVNNPDILLADEPTGALDTETSRQVMDLLKEVAKDRLVVMVTHNPELAEEYATRIVKLRDGRVTADSNPLEAVQDEAKTIDYKNMGKASMSFRTALSLSFNNLRTKKWRTLLTAFAGSIGIIGIALILSLSNGVNNYITSIQKDTMTSYPIKIEQETFDMTSMMDIGQKTAEKKPDHDKNSVFSDNSNMIMESSMMTNITENNLTKFKNYLDDSDSKINDYIGENGIVYSYDTKFDIYSYDSEGVLVNADGSGINTFDSEEENNAMHNGMMSAMGVSKSDFGELLSGKDGNGISSAISDNYDVLYGSWPTAYNEVILVLDENNEIPFETMYKLGLFPSSEYKEINKKLEKKEDVTIETKSLSYEDLCKQTLYMMPVCDYYVPKSNGYYSSVKDDPQEMKNKVTNAVALKITGIVRLKADSDNAFISTPIGYTRALTDYIIQKTNESAVVKAQQDSHTTSVFNGLTFGVSDDAAKAADATIYLSNLGVSDKASMVKEIMMSQAGGDSQTDGMMAMSETELAGMLDEFLAAPDPEELVHIYDGYISPGSYEDNLKTLGVISKDAPSSISIYADSFEDKDAISDCIKDYNKDVQEKDKISYTDYVALLMSSVTTIVNVISYVLIAFVAVSLIVSSIMIGIITYISVLERTKEIGILRAIGASKRNISQVFNAETFIIGLCSGLIGVGITLLLLFPINAIVHAVAGSTAVNAALPIVSGCVLVVLSMLLTLIGGLIPSGSAAKKDPVAALRSE